MTSYPLKRGRKKTSSVVDTCAGRVQGRRHKTFIPEKSKRGSQCESFRKNWDFFFSLLKKGSFRAIIDASFRTRKRRENRQFYKKVMSGEKQVFDRMEKKLGLVSRRLVWNLFRAGFLNLAWMWADLQAGLSCSG